MLSAALSALLRCELQTSPLFGDLRLRFISTLLTSALPRQASRRAGGGGCFLGVNCECTGASTRGPWEILPRTSWTLGLGVPAPGLHVAFHFENRCSWEGHRSPQHGASDSTMIPRGPHGEL